MKEEKGLPLLELATAYQSLRESGFDFSTAIGELIDNSVQANAKRIDIIPQIEQKQLEGIEGLVPVITQVSVVDDGDGMNEKTLNGCPQLGFSTRYNDREGLGRFGVGATYAAISQCKRATFCSHPKGNDNLIATYIDMDEIAGNTQTDIPKPSKSHLPDNLKDLRFDNPSTIVVWDKCDRLQSDANGKPIRADERLKKLKHWVSRAYRYFIWEGVEIYIKSEKVVAYDPLYLNTEQTEFPDDPCATEEFFTSFEWPVPNAQGKTSSISVKLTLLPEEWRTAQGDGGRQPATDRRIPENQGLSILRHHREVTFGNFYPMVPSQAVIDRWWGCEINFKPELDECWEVRNIKRGARPIKELRDKLNELLSLKICKLRKEVQNYWKRGISADIVQRIHQETSSLFEKNNSVTVPEVKNHLQGLEISADDVSQIIAELAIEKGWDWTTDGTHRKYTKSLPPLSESEREICFKTIICAIENSDIDQKFKDVALYDLGQARVSYKSSAFKACIVMFGAVIEGLMLGVIRKNTTLNRMISAPKEVPKDARKLVGQSFLKPEKLAELITEKLTFENYKDIIVYLKPEIDKLKIEGIQSFRNTIHPWQSIKAPHIFSDPSQIRAINYLSALSILAEKILD